jgi:hypothetical protein
MKVPLAKWYVFQNRSVRRYKDDEKMRINEIKIYYSYRSIVFCCCGWIVGYNKFVSIFVCFYGRYAIKPRYCGTQFS